MWYFLCIQTYFNTDCRPIYYPYKSHLSEKLGTTVDNRSKVFLNVIPPRYVSECLY